MIKRFSLYLLFGFLFASQTLAHSGGFTHEETVGEYFVDVGANRMEMSSNELIVFEYNLYHNTDPNHLTDFDSVYVTVSDQAHGVVFAGPVHRSGADWLTVMSYSFPKAGDYIMSARFDKAGNALAETTFMVPVKGDSAQKIGLILKFSVLALIVIAGITYWLKHKHDKPATS
ncbi:MAG: hypothetical protein KW793_01500 [Candidatus Doudnabacteria bacterium]|nr:hypothetical protein [Candidatus Doudnabacteria bacterium]